MNLRRNREKKHTRNCFSSEPLAFSVQLKRTNDELILASHPLTSYFLPLTSYFLLLTFHPSLIEIIYLQ